MDDGIVACAVLSGNRNFESRIHPAVRAAFLASPPLVVAFALVGSVNVDVDTEPLGVGKDGEKVYLRDLWPSTQEIEAVLTAALRPDFYREAYGGDMESLNPLWGKITQASGEIFPWEDNSSYIKEPPFLASPLRNTVLKDISGARALAILGNSVTTDHISPIGSIKASSPAGQYLQALGVKPIDFNNYGARRMNHEVMIRGAFSNLQLKNFMVPGVEGGVTVHQPDGKQTSIYDAAMLYQAEKVPLIVIAGDEYGTGSARDWAAKAPRLLGVRAVIAGSFERIHRSNLVGMGVLPCQFIAGTNAATYGLSGTEIFDLVGLDEHVKPGQTVTLVVHRSEWRSHRGSVDASPRYANGSRICAPRQHHVVRAQRVDEAPACARRVRPLYVPKISSGDDFRVRSLNSLIAVQNSLFLQFISLFFCVGNLAVSH